MEAVLNQIIGELKAISTAVMTVMTEDRPVSVVHGNWQFPSVSRGDLSNKALLLLQRIQDNGETVSKEQVLQFPLFVEKLVFLRSNTVPQLWASPQIAIPIFFITLDALSSALDEVLDTTPTKDEITAAVLAYKKLRGRIQALTSELDSAEPKTKNLAEMLGRIEQAHLTADQLPTDLADLVSKRREMAELLGSALIDLREIGEAKGRSIDNTHEIESTLKHAHSVLSACEHAYGASTSVGLAAAFSERSGALAWSMRGWVTGLFAALAIGGYVASIRFAELSALIALPSVTGAGIALSLILSISSVGGAIWFAWVATKQIGQRFRLSEDYAFKASISRAYEGFRKEAARIDPEMEINLLRSALQRLDEQPLRLVESDTHATPMSELLNSPIVQRAVNSVPGFFEEITSAASDALKRAKPMEIAPAPKNAATAPSV
jgi:HEPN domain-containing protein